MTKLSEKAKQFALRKHAGQTDDSGKPVFAHPKQVAELLALVGAPEPVVAAGYLHDTIEDTDTTYDELVSEFGKQVADLVYEVTQEGAKDRFGYYFPRLHSREAIMIKFADRLSNLTRMEPWPKQRQDHYLRKSQFWKSARNEVNSWQHKQVGITS